MKIEIGEAQRIARTVAGYYRRAVPVAAEPHMQDLLQEGVIAVLQASATYDDARGAWEAYAFHAASQAIRRYLWRYRAAMSPPRAERGGVPFEALSLGVPSAPLERAVQLMLGTLRPPRSPDEQLDELRTSARVRAVLRRLDVSRHKQATKVLLGEGKPAEVRLKRQPMRQVRYAVKNLRRRAERSEELAAIWRELESP